MRKCRMLRQLLLGLLRVDGKTAEECTQMGTVNIICAIYGFSLLVVSYCSRLLWLLYNQPRQVI